MTCVTCFHCGQPVPEGLGLRTLTDTSGEWRDLCISCPELPVRLAPEDATATTELDLRLCISPSPHHTPGLWLKNRRGEPLYRVTIEQIEQTDSLLIFTGLDWESAWRQLKWTLPTEHGCQWHTFRKTWLCDAQSLRTRLI